MCVEPKSVMDTLNIFLDVLCVLSGAFTGFVINLCSFGLVQI